MENLGSPGIVPYLDDFLVVSSSYKSCLHTLNVLMSTLRTLGGSQPMPGIPWYPIGHSCPNYGASQ